MSRLTHYRVRARSFLRWEAGIIVGLIWWPLVALGTAASRAVATVVRWASSAAGRRKAAHK